MAFLFGGSDRPQLDRIEKAVGQLTTIVQRIDERTKNMAQQEQDLNAALQDFFTTINDGLARIEAKLNELPESVDLTDEISAIKEAQAAFQSRIDADTNPPA